MQEVPEPGFFRDLPTSGKSGEITHTVSGSKQVGRIPSGRSLKEIFVGIAVREPADIPDPRLRLVRILVLVHNSKGYQGQIVGLRRSMQPVTGIMILVP